MLCVAALWAGAALLWAPGWAGYTSQTASSGNRFDAGTVTITDDDSGTQVFAATGMRAGEHQTRCLAVSFAGSLTSAVRLYVTGLAQTGALASWLLLTVDEGSGGSFASSAGLADCGAGFRSATRIWSGTLASLAGTATSYDTGVLSWSPSGAVAETRVYRFRVAVDDAAPGTTTGSTVVARFVFESRNT